MKRGKKLVIAVSLAVTGLLLLPIRHGLAEEVEAESDEAVQVEETPGTEAKTLTFTEAALTHLGVKTETVRKFKTTHRGEVGPRMAIPHSAMSYNAEGHPWVYVKEGPGTFLRKSIVIDFMDADYIYLSGGLEAGDEVVTVGVSEMIGAEFGVGEGE